jgi:hypothetical protein
MLGEQKLETPRYEARRMKHEGPTQSSQLHFPGVKLEHPPIEVLGDHTQSPAFNMKE